jgi:hypothetical protein
MKSSWHRQPWEHVRREVRQEYPIHNSHHKVQPTFGIGDAANSISDHDFDIEVPDRNADFE